jgi:uncharacterized protein with von Willebrand factor type A (vWA) domain
MLRRAGLPVGPAEMLAGAAALQSIDIGDRAQAMAALRATMVHRHEHFLIFDHAFGLFWRDPEAGRHAAAMAMLEGFKEPPKPPPASRRLADAMRGDRPEPPKPPEPKEEEQLDVTFTVSERERLQTMDFEAMSAAEINAAKDEIRKLVLPLDARPTRRFRASHMGTHADLRLTVRDSLRTGGEILDISRRKRIVRTPPLVVLCDISGSMSRYAQVLLHFIHAVTNDRDRVHAFLFGTRLTNVTRQLRHRDPEAAFQMVSHAVPDWSGGTRIGDSLELFNRLWSRRVLGQGAVVLLITDGLDREGARGLPEATERLRKSCRRLVWLNPLLRYAGFQPKSQGIRAMLPHVDEFRPVHNLASLRELVAALSDRHPGRGREFAT